MFEDVFAELPWHLAEQQARRRKAEAANDRHEHDRGAEQRP